MSERKRALVVDDSRSARILLRRMLEKHDILVDTVESARDALEFLTVNRPDVIFMDHMMPGMDGFEAVRAIKDNPQTATIPVMMYTSRGGDLYLGQARALGAVGVLPKTVEPAELFEALRRIGLVRERRRHPRLPGVEAADTAPGQADEGNDEGESPRHRNMDPLPAAAHVLESAALEETAEEDRLQKLLDAQRVELRKDLLLALDTATRQTRERLDRVLEEKLEILRARLTPPAPPSRWPLALLTGLFGLVLLWHMAAQEIRRPEPVAAAADSRAHIAAASAGTVEHEDDRIDPRLVWEALDWAINQETDYPWNEIALDGPRMQTVAQLLTRLGNAGFSGRVLVETHAGRFCLKGNPEQGFRLAPGNTPLDQCDEIMNPVQPGSSASTRQSLAFANMVSSSPWLQDGSISLEVRAAGEDDPLVPYPPRDGDTRAEQWNQAAAANNRIMLRLLPALP